MDAFHSIAEMMESCAAEAAVLARERFGFTLDYSPASIQSLETVLANIGPEINASDKSAVEQAVKHWGGYFGETVRRNFGGAWDLVQYPGKVAAVPTLIVAGSQVFPLVKVYRRLTLGESENVWEFYQKICTRLSSVPSTDKTPE